MNKMSALRGNSSYEKMIEGLGSVPAGVQEFIKGIFNHSHSRGKCINAAEKVSWVLRRVPYQYKTQEMCIKAVEEDPSSLIYVPDHFKIQDMCRKAVYINPFLLYAVSLKFFPDHLKTREMCERALEKDPYMLGYVSDHLKMQGMCDKAEGDYLFSLQLVPDWFVTQQLIVTWYDDDYV